MKKLYRSEETVILTGLLGGVGEYFKLDPVIVRIGFVAFLIFTGLFPGVFIYIIALFVVPKKPHYEYVVVDGDEPA